MSSACYVYAIVRRDAPLPACGATALAAVPWRGLAAVTGRADADAPPPTLEAVLLHEAIVEAVRDRVPALPVRFGTVFRDATSVASALAARYDALAADLDRVGDKVELGLTVLWSAAGTAGAVGASDAPAAARRDDGAGAGARYLRARAAEARRDEGLREQARAVAGALDAALGGLALERRLSLLPTPRIALRAAYLLQPAGVDAFRAAFESTRAAHGGLRFLLTGPWPPYGFVARPGEDGDGASHGRQTTRAGPRGDTGGERPG